MRVFRFAFALAGAVIGAHVLMTGPARAQSGGNLDELSRQVDQLYQAGKYAEGIIVGERYVALVKSQFGEDLPPQGGRGRPDARACHPGNGPRAGASRCRSELQQPGSGL